MRATGIATVNHRIRVEGPEGGRMDDRSDEICDVHFPERRQVEPGARAFKEACLARHMGPIRSAVQTALVGGLAAAGAFGIARAIA